MKRCGPQYGRLTRGLFRGRLRENARVAYGRTLTNVSHIN